MKLLTFAHRGEAQYFINADNYKPVDFEFKGLFKNDESYLLITGEGLQNTSKKLSVFFSQQSIKIDKLINIGIAGALDSSLELDSIYCINKVYSEEYDQIFFSEDSNNKINCVTAKNRVLDKEYAELLLKMAPIVDLELWACAKICSEFGIPLQSFKLISDYAGNSLTDDIIKKVKVFSEKLYNYYLKIS